MSLLTFPFKLPLLPVHAVMRLAEIIQDEAERTLADPATIRRELEQIEQARASGEVSDEEAAELEKQALARFTRLRRGGTAAVGGGEG
jgi:Gas vesicle protein G